LKKEFHEIKIKKLSFYLTENTKYFRALCEQNIERLNDKLDGTRYCH